MEAATPMGMAVFSQVRASRVTMLRICLLLAPIQRSIPKKCVRSAILAFMLPEIINTPAITTNRTSTAEMP